MERIIGIDVARTLAILGMFVLHAVPTAQLESVPLLSETVGGNRPQLLFAVLDGVSLAIVASTSPSRTAARRAIAIRAVCLIALGLFLTTLGTGVIVILDYYGFFFLLALPALFLSATVTIWLALTLAALGPAIVAGAFEIVGGAEGYLALPPLVSVLADWLLMGQYPAAVWLAFIFFGVWMFRRGISADARNLRDGVIAALVALLLALGVPFLAAAPPFVRATVENASAGSAAAALIWLAVPLFRRIARWIPSRVIRGAFALGAMPVTAYVLHIVVMASFALVGVTQDWNVLWVVWIACALVTAAWAQIFARGPLESAMAWLSICYRPGYERLETSPARRVRYRSARP